MSNLKFHWLPRTEWISAQVKPVHYGWYEIQFVSNLENQSPNPIQMMLFNPRTGQWSYKSDQFGMVPDMWFGVGKLGVFDRWRGLAEKLPGLSNSRLHQA